MLDLSWSSGLFSSLNPLKMAKTLIDRGGSEGREERPEMSYDNSFGGDKTIRAHVSSFPLLPLDLFR